MSTADVIAHDLVLLAEPVVGDGDGRVGRIHELAVYVPLSHLGSRYFVRWM